jgi:hypothetical protein
MTIRCIDVTKKQVITWVHVLNQIFDTVLNILTKINKNTAILKTKKIYIDTANFSYV